jgi:hypothetical protein
MERRLKQTGAAARIAIACGMPGSALWRRSICIDPSFADVDTMTSPSRARPDRVRRSGDSRIS